MLGTVLRLLHTIAFYIRVPSRPSHAHGTFFLFLPFVLVLVEEAVCQVKNCVLRHTGFYVLHKLPRGFYTQSWQILRNSHPRLASIRRFSSPCLPVRRIHRVEDITLNRYRGGKMTPRGTYFGMHGPSKVPITTL